MTKTKETHTPGPWKCKDWRVCAFEGDFATKIVVDTAHNKRTHTEENKANARLIAASPELLAACKVIVTAERDWQGKCAAAIAKATGQD